MSLTRTNHVDERSTHNDLSIARLADGDWLWTMPFPSVAFARRCYGAALFTLPNMTASKGAVLLANPTTRYCIDLERADELEVNWARSAKMRAPRRARFRLTVDADFDGSLRRLIAHHAAGEGGTWFDEELLRTIERMRAEDEAELGVGATVRLVGLSSASKNGLLGTVVAPAVAHPGGRVRVELLPPPSDEGAATGATGAATATTTAAVVVAVKPPNLELVAPSPRRDKVHHHVFELWDATTGELLALTAGFGVGRAFHDYSMATLVKDKRSAGAVLSKTVAHLLSKCGYGLWYWGFKNPYMAAYDAYGGRQLEREEFNDRWAKLREEEPMMELCDAIAAGLALVAPREEGMVGEVAKEEC